MIPNGTAATVKVTNGNGDIPVKTDKDYLCAAASVWKTKPPHSSLFSFIELTLEKQLRRVL